MKPHIHFSPDEPESKGSNEPVKRLSERYNIPEKDVEALLYGSRAPKLEVSGSTKEKSMPQDPNYGPPQKQSGWSTANILSLIVGILGIMALTIILVQVIHNGRHEFPHYGMNIPPPPPIMPAPNPPQPMPDTSKNPNPATNHQQQETAPPASQNEPESKPAKIHRSAPHTSGGFMTSNSIEAQEHLAELRAEGNTKAKIRQMKKNGVTIYSVK
jgi:hypothetical protein